MRFVDRKEELAALNEAYLTRNSNLVVVYGRRRIGKTELIKRFGEEIGKRFAYYLCDTTPISEQTRRLAATVGIAIGDEELISMGAASIEAKPRDLYDLWFLLSNNFTIDADLVNKKMQFDHAIFSIERLKARIEEIRPLWESPT